jgi:hypothetical protein
LVADFWNPPPRTAHRRREASVADDEGLPVRAKKWAATKGISTSRDSRIGFPLSNVSKTGLSQGCPRCGCRGAEGVRRVVTTLGCTNAVAGPYFNDTAPEPTGVVGVLAPQESSLLGLVSVLAPIVVTGNTCVVLASQHAPLPAITLGEVLATSDVPDGVVNILSGHTAELAPWIASHQDVNALDLTGATEELAQELERAAADTLKRVQPPPSSEPDWTAQPGTDRLTAFLEAKTVWHPIGLCA